MKAWVNSVVEEGREVGVQLVVGLLVAYALVYLPATDAIRSAETNEALGNLGWIAGLDWPPGAYLIAGIVAATMITAAVYACFGKRGRALFIVVAFGIVAMVLHVGGKGRAPLVHASIVGALVTSVTLTVWHELWLESIYEDD